MFSRFIHTVVYINIPFIFKVEQYSIVYHNLFICSSIDGVCVIFPFWLTWIVLPWISTYVYLSTCFQKEMATHSSTLAWKIPWTGRLHSPWDCKESHTTKQLQFQFTFLFECIWEITERNRKCHEFKFQVMIKEWESFYDFPEILS